MKCAVTNIKTLWDPVRACKTPDNKFGRMLHQNEHCIAICCHVLTLGQEISTPLPVLIQLYLTHTLIS
jgi:hypothetical protein